MTIFHKDYTDTGTIVYKDKSGNVVAEITESGMTTDETLSTTTTDAYGIDLNSSTPSTADIRFSNGEILKNTTDGTLETDATNFIAINIDAGKSGTAGSFDAYPATASKGKFSITCTNQTGDTAVTLNANAMGQATQINLADPGAAASYVAQSTAALTLAEVDVLDGATSTVVTASKAVIADANAKINLATLSGNASASGLLMGVGTSANPATTSTADAKFIEIRAKNTATSGDNRLAYFRFDLNGAGGGGESLRSFTDLTAAGGTAHGAHISLQAGDTGYISGLGVGVRAQLFLKDAASPAGGTYYAGQSEVWSDGASSSIAAVTKHAIHSFAATGNATGMATVLNALSFDGTSAGDATKMISSVSLAELPTSTVGVAILVNGTRYYIPAVLETEWN